MEIARSYDKDQEEEYLVIRCYLIKFADRVTIPKWVRYLHRVLRDIPDDLATYKGFIANRELLVNY